MKNYQSTQEGQWHELLNPDLTQEMALVKELIEEKKFDALRELQEAIRLQREGPVPAEKAEELSQFYLTQKPPVPEGQAYQLIAMDVTEQDSVFRGILNCRVNGEHIQVRF
jgi:hypothetical protein